MRSQVLPALALVVAASAAHAQYRQPSAFRRVDTPRPARAAVDSVDGTPTRMLVAAGLAGAAIEGVVIVAAVQSCNGELCWPGVLVPLAGPVFVPLLVNAADGARGRLGSAILGSYAVTLGLVSVGGLVDSSAAWSVFAAAVAVGQIVVSIASERSSARKNQGAR